MQNNQRYLVNYEFNDKQELDKFLLIVSHDKTRRYKNQKWEISVDTLDELIKAIPENHFSYVADASVGQNLKLSLYEYQKDIVKYCVEKGNAIIVAPCGAGKTPALLSIYLDLKQSGKISTWAQGLIVVKSSLKYQWGKEVEKFTDLTYCLVDTYKALTAPYSAKIKTKEKKKSELLRDPIYNSTEILALQEEIGQLTKEMEQAFLKQFDDKYNLFIVNYETLRDAKVRKALHKAKIEVVLSDEVHYIKTDTSARAKALCEFNDVLCRFGATATPIQKNPLDAFSISKLISPTTFKNKSAFSARYLKYSGFGRVCGSQNERELNQKLSDYMIVVSKEEVFKQLPETTVVTRYCELTDKQIRMTTKLMAEIAEFKEQEEAIMRRFAGKPPANNEELLKIQANILARQTFASELADSEELLAMSDSKLAKNYITKSPSGKIEMLLDLLEEIFDSGEKVVVFSKYRKMQDVLTKAIKDQFPDIDIAYVNGTLSSQERYNEVYTKFRDTDKCKVLIMSDAGAEGINASTAKYLIEMEPADSYLIQTQRRGRIERADSTHSSVFCYQLIAEKSYDEIGLKIIEKKEKYDAQIIKGNV